MSEHKTHYLEFDDTGLGHASEAFNLPPPRAIESLSALVSRVEPKQSYPKEYMRKLWLRKSTGRKKTMKQLRDAESKLEYWMSKRLFLVGVIHDCEACLHKLDMSIMSDITTP